MSEICEFFKDQHVFITGGNGFIGKILVEKLLRSTDVAVIYLLIRRKKGKDVSDRLQEMLENEPFLTLKKKRPDFKNQIKVIVGDSTLLDLGLSNGDFQTLVSKINVVFHVAATIRFHEDIKIAYDTNVGMTIKIISLCKQMNNLKSFIYVSTAYANCYLKSIDEVFYDGLDFDYGKIETILEEPSGAEKLTQKILQKWPNTYSFTKAVAELVIRDNARNLPVGIFRPSIVISTRHEPLEGWTDSLGGPNILVITMLSGFLRFFHCDLTKVVDLVPVDMAVAALITCAWDVHKQGRKMVPIYNYISSVDCPITYDEFIKLNILVYGKKYPFQKCLWAPKMIISNQSRLLNFVFDITYHYIPALFFDVLSILCFKKPCMISKYRKFNTSRYHMEYFMLREWTFSNNNVKKMWNKMNEVDKKIFPFDLSAINWLLYIRTYFKGIRFYLFKEPWGNLAEARIKAERLKMAHQIFLFVIYFIGVKCFWEVVKTIAVRCLKLEFLRKT